MGAYLLKQIEREVWIRLPDLQRSQQSVEWNGGESMKSIERPLGARRQCSLRWPARDDDAVWMVACSQCVECLFAIFILLSAVLATTDAAGSKVAGRWSMAPIAPQARAKHALLCDDAAGRLYAIAGRLSSGKNLNDFWVLTPSTKQWQETLIGGTDFVARQAAVVVLYKRVIYVWGGQGDVVLSLDDLWISDQDAGTWKEVSIQAVRPLARRRAASALLHNRGTFLMVFGQATDRLLNDVWEFNMTSLSWLEWSVSGTPPEARFDALCMPLPNGTAVLCFGGTGRAGDYSELWRLDVKARTWTIIQTTTTPSARRLAVGHMDATSMTIGLGYQSSDSGNINDLWMFNLTTREWTMQQATGVAGMPEIRDSGVMCILSGTPYLFGGWGKTAFHNDLWTIATNATTGLRYWSLVMTDISSPPPRARHSMESIGSSIYVAFGKSSTTALADIWAFRTTTQKWSQLKPSAPLPEPRHGASVVVHGNVLFFFGGNADSGTTNKIVSYDTSRNFWSNVETEPGLLPKARSDHGAVILSGDGVMTVFGGLDTAGNVLDDMWLYNFERRVWVQVKMGTSGPQARGAHGMIVLQSVGAHDIILVVGGYAFNGVHFDRWAMNQIDSNLTAQWKEQMNTMQNGTTTLAYIRAEMSLCGSGGRFFIAGGGISRSFSPQSKDTHYMWDPTNGNIPLEPLPLSVYFSSSVFVQRTEYLYGGNVVWNDLKRKDVVTSVMQTYTIDAGAMCATPDEEDGNCMKCGVGSVYNASVKDCVFCPTGTYHLSVTESCEECPAGAFSVTEGATSSNVCLPCQEGTFQPLTGQSKCLPCPSGKTCPVGTFLPNDIVEQKTTWSGMTSTQPKEFSAPGIPSYIYYMLLAFCCLFCLAVSILVTFVYLSRRKRRKEMISRPRKEQIRGLFAKCGGSGEGINESGLFLFFYELRMQITEKEVSTLLLHYDDDGSRSLDLDELYVMLCDLMVAGFLNTELEPISTKPFDSAHIPWRISLKGIDIFKDEHTSGNLGDAMYLKKNVGGGIMTMFYIMACCCFVLILLSQFVWENQQEDRSSLPKVAVNDAFFGSIVVTVQSVSGSQNPLSCIDKTLGDGFCNADTSIVFKNIEVAKGAKVSSTCNFERPSFCRMVWSCTKCTLELMPRQPVVTFMNLHPDMFAGKLGVSVKASTGIPRNVSFHSREFGGSSSEEDSEASMALSPMAAGSVFRGVTHTFVTFEATPTVFKHVDTGVPTVRQTGYHMRLLEYVLGSAVANVDFYNNIGLGVSVQLRVEDTSTLVITRREIQSFVTLFSAILGAISGLSGLCIMLVKRIDGFSLQWRKRQTEKQELDLRRPSSPKFMTRKHTTIAQQKNWNSHVEPLIRSGLTFCTSREIVTAIVELADDMIASAVDASGHGRHNAITSIVSPNSSMALPNSPLQTGISFNLGEMAPMVNSFNGPPAGVFKALRSMKATKTSNVHDAPMNGYVQPAMDLTKLATSPNPRLAAVYAEEGVQDGRVSVTSSPNGERLHAMDSDSIARAARDSWAAVYVEEGLEDGRASVASSVETISPDMLTSADSWKRL